MSLFYFRLEQLTGSSVKGPRPARPDAKLPDALDGRRLDGLVAGESQVVVCRHVEAPDAADRHVLTSLKEGTAELSINKCNIVRKMQ